MPFLTFRPISFDLAFLLFVQQPVAEYIFLHIHVWRTGIHRMFKHQGEIFSFFCPHGCFHYWFFADLIVNGVNFFWVLKVWTSS